LTLQADEASAILHYTLAAAAGDKFSQGAMGYRHYTGLGVPKSCWTAVAYYQPLAEAVIDAALAAGGLPQIERLRLNLHANQGLRSERQREVLQYYQYSADRGNTEAQTTVGTVLIAGTHGLRDHAAAYHYLHRAAAAGDPEAMAHLGSMYAAGVGAPQDWKQALSWFQRSADKGNILAYYSLGYMYLSGKGVGLDADKALTYFTKAAEGGDRDAHFYLGVMYMQVGPVVRRRAGQVLDHIWFGV
jgi:SEL1 protein